MLELLQESLTDQGQFGYNRRSQLPLSAEAVPTNRSHRSPMQEPVSLTAQRDKLVEQYQPYVRAIATEVAKTLPPYVILDELVAYGQIGLIEAADRFDPLRGFAFTTFSYYRIRGAIYDGLREMSQLSRSDLERISFTARANELLKTTADDMSAAHASSASSITDEIAALQSIIDDLIPVYLLSLSDRRVPNTFDNQATPLEQYEDVEALSILLQYITDLPEDERRVIEAAYLDDLPLKSIAEQMGRSKSWISRLHFRGIQRLREKMEEQGYVMKEPEAISNRVVDNNDERSTSLQASHPPQIKLNRV